MAGSVTKSGYRVMRCRVFYSNSEAVMTTVEFDPAKLFDDIAEHIEEAGELAPYTVWSLLEMLFLYEVPTPNTLIPRLTNLQFVNAEYLRAVATWLRARAATPSGQAGGGVS